MNRLLSIQPKLNLIQLVGFLIFQRSVTHGLITVKDGMIQLLLLVISIVNTPFILISILSYFKNKISIRFFKLVYFGMSTFLLIPAVYCFVILDGGDFLAMGILSIPFSSLFIFYNKYL